MSTVTGPEYGDGFWSEPNTGTDHEFWSENVATYHDYRYHLQYGDTLTMGAAQQDYDGGINYVSNVKSMKFLYAHNDVTYSYAPTIVGNALDNTITGPSDYEAHYDGFSTAPAMTVYGSAGDDTIIAHDGVDRLSGGADNDWINSGGGADQVYGGAGNDMLLSGSISGQSGNEVMYGGSGADTFVLGDGTSAATPSELGMIEWNNPYSVDQQATHDMLNFLSKVPKAGAVFSAANTLFDYLNGTGGAAAAANAYSANAVLAEANATQIMDFDPTEDMIVIPLSEDEWGQTGELSLSMDTDGVAVGEGFRIYSDGSQWGSDSIVNHKLIATINWADLASDLPAYVTSALDSSEAMAQFEDSVLGNRLIIDGEAGSITNGVGESMLLSDIDTSAYGANFTDTVMASGNKLLVMGTSIGTHQVGYSGADYMFGGNMADFLYGYDVDDSTGAASAGNDHLYGFDGADIFAGGAGTNAVFGGEGTDTAAYYDAVGGVTVHLETMGTATIGGTDYDYGTGAATYSDGAAGFDYLYDIENVIGSSGDDDITGNADANQLSGGSGGTDVLTGGDGADRFLVSGGETTITDFTAEDSLVFDATGSFGSGGATVESVADLSFASVDGTTTIRLAVTGEALVHVQNATVTADDVQILTPDEDAARNAIYGTSGADGLAGTSGADLIQTGLGDDTVHGGEADDLIVNEGGYDYLYGEDGADTFVFVGGTSAVLDYEDGDLLAISLEGEFGGQVGSTEDLAFSYQDGGTIVSIASTGQHVAEVWADDYSQVVLHAEDILIVDDALVLA